MRKPKNLIWPRAYCAVEDGQRKVVVASYVLAGGNVRKLASWLLKAADWLEEKEKK
jgi:hypothetical protein